MDVSGGGIRRQDLGTSVSLSLTNSSIRARGKQQDVEKIPPHSEAPVRRRGNWQIGEEKVMLDTHNSP